MGLYDKPPTEENVAKPLTSVKEETAAMPLTSIREERDNVRSLYDPPPTAGRLETRTSSEQAVNVSEQLDSEREAKASLFSKKHGATKALSRLAIDAGKGRSYPSHEVLNNPSVKGYLKDSPSDAAISREDLNNGAMLRTDRAVNADTRRVYNIDNSDPIDENDPNDVERLKRESEPTFSKLEKVRRGVQVGEHNLLRGDIGYQQIWNDDPELEAKARRLEAGAPELIPGDSIFEDIAIVSSTMKPLIEKSFIEGQKDAVKVSGAFGIWALALGQVPPLIATPEEGLTVPAAVATGYGVGVTMGAARTIYKQEAGNFYRDALKITDANGRPIDRNALKAAALGYAGVSTIMELAWLKYLISKTPGAEGLLGRLTKPVLKKSLQNPSVVKALAKIGAGLVGTAGVSAFEEGGQEAAAIVAEQLAKHYSENKEGTYFIPFNWKGAFKSRVVPAMEQGALGGLGWGSIGTAVATTKVAIDVTAGNKFNQKFDDVQTEVDQLKTKELSEDSAQKFLEATDLQPEAHFSPDADTMFQEDEKAATELFVKIGVDPVKVRERAALGQDTKVNLAKLHATKLTTEEIDLLQGYLKTAPDGYTKNQIEKKVAVEDMELLKERWDEQQVVEDEFQEGLTSIKDQIKKAGFEDRLAEDVTNQLENMANSFALEGSDRTAFIKDIDIQKRTLKEKLFPNGVTRGAIDVVKSDNPLREHAFKISLFEEANESTVVHEVLGHVALEEMLFIAGKEGVSQRFTDMVDSTYEWLGAEKGAPLSTEQTEQFARGYEQWLREGKAPSVQVASMFARFKNWLKNIYSSASALNVKLSPQIRDVFNKLIDAENETRTAAALNGIVALTPAQMDALGIVNEKQVDMALQAETAMQTAEMRMFRAREKAVNSNKDKVQAEAEQEVAAEDAAKYGVFGVYDLIDDIKENSLQFSRAEYNAAVGNPKGHKFLPAKGLTTTKTVEQGAVSLDDTAFNYGFESTEVFVEAISSTLPKKVAIQNKVNSKNRVIYDSFKSEDFIVGTKEYAAYLETLGEEISRNKAIDEQVAKTGKSRKVISRKLIQQFAKDTLDSSSVVDASRPELYSAAIKRAAIAQSKAIKKKDWATALKENEKMRLNHEMARLAIKNRDYVKTVLARSKRHANSKTVINTHREQIRAIVDRYNLNASISPKRPDKLVPLAELFKSEQHIPGHDAPDFLINPKSRNFVSRYQTLRLEQFKEIDQAIRYLDKIGRQLYKDLLSDGVRKLETVVTDGISDMRTRPFKKNLDDLNIFSGLSNTHRKYFAKVMGMDYIVKLLGGELTTGKLSSLEQNVTEKLKDSRDAKIRLLEEKKKEIRPDSEQLIETQRKLNKENKRRLQIEDNPVPVPVILQNRGRQTDYFTSQQVITMAGYLGSQSNIDALLSGYKGLTLEQVNVLVDEFLTIEDMDAIQNIRDMFESLKKDVEEVHLRTTNTDMKFIEAKPYVFKGKEYKGGYWPISIDRNLALETNFLPSDAEMKTSLDKQRTEYTVPGSPKGRTNERVGHKLPVHLDLMNVYQAQDEFVRYITQTETIRDVNRILNDKRFKSAAIDVMGEEMVGELIPALKNYANPTLENFDIPGNSMINYLRGMATAKNITWYAGKFMTAPKQLGSITGAIHDMGKAHIAEDGIVVGAAKGWKAYMKGVSFVLPKPSAAYNTMLDKSDAMRERQGRIDRDILKPRFDSMTPKRRLKVFGDSEITWEEAKSFGYAHIMLFDAAAVTPIWWGSYLDKINEQGVKEKEAVRYADNIVQGSQPNVDPLTLPAFNRRGGFWGLFNLHSTYTVNIYGQRQRAYFTDWRAGKISKSQYAWFNFMDGMLPAFMIQVMMAVLRGRDLSDRDTWFGIAEGSVVSWLTMGTPIVSAFAGAMTQGWRDVLSIPGAETVDDTAQALNKLGTPADEMTADQRRKLQLDLLKLMSEYARFPIFHLFEQLNEGEDFREKMFGKDYKPKKKQSRRIGR